jgi:hypothetical protein
MYATQPMPRTFTKVGLAYHVNREANGTPLSNDPTRGQFWMTVIPDSDSGFQPPSLYVTGGLSSTKPPGTTTTFKVSGLFWDEWQRTVPGTIVGLYEDESVAALKGVMMSSATSTYFFPFADGTVSEQLKDGNDFRVMERGICVKLRGEAYCGTALQSTWGL